MFGVIVMLIFIGFIVWLATTLIPMDGKIRQVVYGIVCFVVFIWLLNVLGLWSGGIGSLRLR